METAQTLSMTLDIAQIALIISIAIAIISMAIKIIVSIFK